MNTLRPSIQVQTDLTTAETRASTVRGRLDELVESVSGQLVALAAKSARSLVDEAVETHAEVFVSLSPEKQSVYKTKAEEGVASAPTALAALLSKRERFEHNLPEPKDWYLRDNSVLDWLGKMMAEALLPVGDAIVTAGLVWKDSGYYGRNRAETVVSGRHHTRGLIEAIPSLGRYAPLRQELHEANRKIGQLRDELQKSLAVEAYKRA